ncbi:MAG: hypothetical protein EXQ77_01200 [Thermoleophilia bacterium]|nr:hypothetical protein [Thermoleophilia bacterium]
MSLSPRHEHSARPIPKHPYRDSALLYGSFAVVLVAAGAATGSDLWRTVGIAGAFFVLATGWAWFRFRQRIRAAARNGR